MNPDHRDAAAPAGLLSRLAEWWRARSELSHMPADEIERMAHDMGMSAQELSEIAAKGPHAADLLYERMAAMGVTRADVDRIAFGLIRDLERDCSCCGDKDVCAHDLATQPESPGWMAYCANAATLEAVRKAKGRALV